MDDFNFYNSENDGYRGGFGDYSDPIPTGGGPVQPGQAPHKKGGGKRIAALILACAIVGGGAGVGGAALYSHFSGSGSTTIYEAVEHPQVQTVVNSNSGKAMTPEQLYAANLGSCVGITVSTTTVNIFGQATTSAASGSGFVLTQDGYIVTNYHVIEEAANDSSVSVEVAFANGDKYTAKLVGGEKDNDVAVLKIDATGLTPAVIGDSDKLAVGETTVAVGNPLGTLSNTVTQGIVSALNRQVTVEDNNMTLIQTDTSISPGNSGGGLFNANGELIGVVNAKSSYSEAEGIGFAIPINTAMDIAQQLIENGAVARPVLGVSILDVQDSSTAQQYGVSALGVYVADVTKGGGAEAAGVQRGDRIIAIDDTAVSSTSTVKSYLADKQVGDTVTLQVERDGKVLTLNVTLGNSAQ